MDDTEYIYARLVTGCPLSWLRLLAQGWSFCGYVIEPMEGSHADYAVLMVRTASHG